MTLIMQVLSWRALPHSREALDLRALVLSWRALPSSHEAFACVHASLALALPGMHTLHGICVLACWSKLS